MKLSKLYSNDGRFHSIEFNPGMNVVLGKVTRRYDRECDSHNLGKSTLVDLLDFMLLKDIDAKHIFRRFRDLFASHVNTTQCSRALKGFIQGYRNFYSVWRPNYLG